MSYDYTREQTGSSIESADDFVMVAAAPSKSAEDIERENAKLEIPPGEHLLVVKGFAGPPKPEKYSVFVNGALADFHGWKITVIFQLPGKPQYTVQDNFVLLPHDPREHKAYFEGKGKADEVKGKADDDSGGFHANKLMFFLSRLGFDWPPGGQLPTEALTLKNWKGRAIHAKVTPARPYKDKDEVMQPGFPQIKLFSYRRAEGAAALGSLPSGTPNGSVAAATAAATSAPQAAVAAPAQHQPSGAQNVLDNI
jgi:hypothetical protein